MGEEKRRMAEENEMEEAEKKKKMRISIKNDMKK